MKNSHFSYHVYLALYLSRPADHPSQGAHLRSTTEGGRAPKKKGEIQEKEGGKPRKKEGEKMHTYNGSGWGSKFGIIA